MSNTMKTFTLEDGEPIEVSVSGSGHPLLLVHGWTSGPHIWAPFVDTLSQHFQVVVWRARGHGPLRTKLSLAERPLTVEQLAYDLKYLIQKFQLKDPIIVGHSMGAMLSLEYFSQFGINNIKGSVLVDQSPCCLNRPDWSHSIYGNFTSSMNEKHIQNMKLNFSEGVLQLAAQGLNTDIACGYKNNSPWVQDLRTYLDSLDAQAMISLWESFSVKDWRPILPTLSFRTGLIFGSQSQFYTLDTKVYLEKHLTQCKGEVIEGAHHSPQITHPQKFEEALFKMLSFIQESQ